MLCFVTISKGTLTNFGSHTSIEVQSITVNTILHACILGTEMTKTVVKITKLFLQCWLWFDSLLIQTFNIGTFIEHLNTLPATCCAVATNVDEIVTK